MGGFNFYAVGGKTVSAQVHETALPDKLLGI